MVVIVMVIVVLAENGVDLVREGIHENFLDLTMESMRRRALVALNLVLMAMDLALAIALKTEVIFFNKIEALFFILVKSVNGMERIASIWNAYI